MRLSEPLRSSCFCYHGAMEDELNRYLDNLGGGTSFRVEKVLKEGALETTELVWLVGCGGDETGPFIRKTIADHPGLGQAYRRLFDAQQRGQRFLYLPRVVDCREVAGSPTVVMEYVRGVTLAQLVESQGPSLELARGVFPFICDGASEMHERFSPPLIHRDLKPGNVMVSEGGVTLIDLGIARNFSEGAQADTCCFGTRSYAPPEQFGFGQTDVRSDVYALGLILFFCLTGRDPLPSDRDHIWRDPAVPEPLRKVIVRAAAFDPAQRYGSAAELKSAFLDGLRALEGADGQASISAQAPPPQGVPWPAAGQSAAPTHAVAGRSVASDRGYAQPSATSARRAAAPVSSPKETDGSASAGRFWAGRSLAAGVLVDVLLALLAVFILYIVVDMSVNPSPGSSAYDDPLPMRFVENATIGLFVMILPLYLVADKRLLCRLSPLFRPLTMRQACLALAAGWIATLAVFMVVTIARRSIL